MTARKKSKKYRSNKNRLVLSAMNRNRRNECDSNEHCTISFNTIMAVLTYLV